MNPTESFIVTHFNEVVSLIIAAAMGWAGRTLYATIQQGYVDSEGLTNVGFVYEAYHELKGNGTGTNLYERMKALPLREDHTA